MQLADTSDNIVWGPGYYWDAASGYAYDGNTGLYYHSSTNLWYQQDPQTGQMAACEGQDGAHPCQLSCSVSHR